MNEIEKFWSGYKDFWTLDINYRGKQRSVDILKKRVDVLDLPDNIILNGNKKIISFFKESEKAKKFYPADLPLFYAVLDAVQTIKDENKREEIKDSMINNFQVDGIIYTFSWIKFNSEGKDKLIHYKDMKNERSSKIDTQDINEKNKSNVLERFIELDFNKIMEINNWFFGNIKELYVLLRQKPRLGTAYHNFRLISKPGTGNVNLFCRETLSYSKCDLDEQVYLGVRLK
ncbi:MAG: hypothetical protein PHD81_00095 [Candidatus Nanoarchaeia archaeon]|nr:hypothetical protein [Candidatus Nanoarchaeia archaeon]MDD5587492.1 hypothetical protein [Candidatus Nanoarchaeia archaeon]